MSVKIIPAVMSGGSGTRLWPLSTPDRPKQFHALAQEHTLIQATVSRFLEPHPDIRFLAPVVIANARHGAIVAEQLSAIDSAPSLIALEPEGRNTAATALVAALLGTMIDPEALVLLLPADHVIRDANSFLDAIARAAASAHDHIVTFGITPSEPATGYGYIEAGAPIANGVFAISRFLEKPNREVAEKLFADPAYTWNAGVFLFAPKLVIEEFARVPEVGKPVTAAVSAARHEKSFMYLDGASFSQAQSTPFDIAIMQSTTRGAVVPCEIGWADVGSWAEIWRLASKDAKHNAVQGKAVCQNSEGCLVIASGTRVAVSGLNDVMVIATPDGVLVLPRGRAQEVKGLTELLGGLDG
jgi:mannose-1-phosphate guanylyltransferase/mannose-6-phosphate isomerase